MRDFFWNGLLSSAFIHGRLHVLPTAAVSFVLTSTACAQNIHNGSKVPQYLHLKVPS